MKYTLHTWEIEHTEEGPVAKNKKQFVTTSHKELMGHIKALVGTGVQYVVNRQLLTAAVS